MTKRSAETDEAQHGNDSTENKRHKSDTKIGSGVTASSEVVRTDLIFSEIRPLWKGIENLENLVVFGDSSTRFGSCKTWLPQFLSSQNKKRLVGARELTAFNYAAAGSTVEDDLATQMDSFFTQFPNDDAKERLEPSRTLFVVWLGINDCGRTSPEDLKEIVETLFQDGLDDLYVKAGARNFLLFDVPPKDRSPGGLRLSVDLTERIETWNDHLLFLSKTFVSESKQASLFLFSAYRTVSRVLDNPEDFDFEESDIEEEGGNIWMDELHFTEAVHTIISRQLENSLS